MPEGVCEAACQELRELAPFLIGEACIPAVGLRVLQVYFLVGDIKVPADDYGL